MINRLIIPTATLNHSSNHTLTALFTWEKTRGGCDRGRLTRCLSCLSQWVSCLDLMMITSWVREESVVRSVCNNPAINVAVCCVEWRGIMKWVNEDSLPLQTQDKLLICFCSKNTVSDKRLPLSWTPCLGWENAPTEESSASVCFSGIFSLYSFLWVISSWLTCYYPLIPIYLKQYQRNPRCLLVKQMIRRETKDRNTSN